MFAAVVGMYWHLFIYKGEVDIQAASREVAQIEAQEVLKKHLKDKQEARQRGDLESATLRESKADKLMIVAESFMKAMQIQSKNIADGLNNISTQLSSNGEKLDTLLGAATEPDEPDTLVVTKGSSESKTEEPEVEEPKVISVSMKKKNKEDDGKVECANPDCSKRFKRRGNKKYHSQECRETHVNKDKS